MAIDIAGRKVGPGHPCFVIAEAGVNHNGSLALACRLVDAAVAAGADAVKFQSFKTDRLVTRTAAKADYQVEQTGNDESQHQMLARLELTAEHHHRLLDHARRRNILFMSTPFDEESADFLNELGVAVFKLPSGELTNLPFLAQVARYHKPIILSTGMAFLGEVEAAVRAIRETGNDQLVLLHCVSNYPADPAHVNLRAMRTMAETFAVPAGYSDHTLGNEIPLAAVAMGACVIEKHLTLDRSLPGPDHRASSPPEEFGSLVEGIRKVESALGNGSKQPAASEAATAMAARKSLVASRDIAAGSSITADAIAVRRPGAGMPPAARPRLVGRIAKSRIPEGTLLSLDMVA